MGIYWEGYRFGVHFFFFALYIAVYHDIYKIFRSIKLEFSQVLKFMEINDDTIIPIVICFFEPNYPTNV